MTVPLTACEMTFTFTLSQLSEAQDIAEFSIWSTDTEQQDPQLLDIAEGGYNSWVTHAEKANHCTGVALTSVRTRNFLENGHTLREQVFVPDTPWTGTATQPSLPWETALCISLYTYPRGSFITDGKRKRGRFYMPPFSSAVLASNDSGFIADNVAHGVLGQMHDFLRDAWQSHLGVDEGTLGVLSRVDGVCRPVIQISLDAKIDSQRRRQNREIAGVLTQDFSY